MSDDPQLTLKQEILKSEILEKNYDKDKFIQFCLNQKENGDDLTKWTLLELNECISNFIKAENEAQNQINNNNINNYFRLQNELYGRLNYNLKNYYVNTIAACKNLEQVQKDFETLHLLNNRVLMKQEITKSFEILGIFFKNWKRILENQNEIIKI